MAAACLVVRADLPPAFSDVNLDAAKKQVEGSDKVVVIKFTADWCPPCKAMDKTTWRDESVVKWVKDHGVAIQVDVDKDQKTAGAYNIEAMPTMVMLKGGSEIARKIGYMDPKQTLSWMEAAAAGKATGESKPFAPKAPARPATPDKMMSLLEQLRIDVEDKKYDHAIGVLREIWSPANADDSLRMGGAATMMYGALDTLRRDYPDSKAAMTEIRDTIEKRLKSGKKSTMGDLSDWIVLNEMLSDDARSLAWFDRIKGQEGSERTFSPVLHNVLALLERNERFADIPAVIPNAPEWATKRHARISKGVDQLNRSSPGLGDTQLRAFEWQAARIYAGYLAAQRLEEADRLAAELLRLRDTQTMRMALVQESLNAGVECQNAEVWLTEAEKSGADVSALRQRLSSLPKK